MISGIIILLAVMVAIPLVTSSVKIMRGFSTVVKAVMSKVMPYDSPNI